MIIDAHIHMFTPAIVANVAQRKQVAAELHLQAGEAPGRLTVDALEEALRDAGVELALHLPTANAAGVQKVNRRALALAREHAAIATAGTLHPQDPRTSRHLAALHTAGVRAIKLCSFSQGFQVDEAESEFMFARIDDFNARCRAPFFVVLDTYYRATDQFGCPFNHVTTPGRLAALVRRFPHIIFVGAHMGGLCAPVETLLTDLPAAPNLYLDTSNAAHTLPEDIFRRLLHIHGPEHILFGTDWPWFHPKAEIPMIDRLMIRAGFSESERAAVFGENAARLLKFKIRGISPHG